MPSHIHWHAAGELSLALLPWGFIWLPIFVNRLNFKRKIQAEIRLISNHFFVWKLLPNYIEIRLEERGSPGAGLKFWIF